MVPNPRHSGNVRRTAAGLTGAYSKRGVVMADQAADAARVHTMFALWPNQMFTVAEIAEWMDWPAERVDAAVDDGVRRGVLVRQGHNVRRAVAGEGAKRK